MPHRRLCCLALCLVAALYCAACGGSSPALTNLQSRGSCLLIYGDSLAAGYQIDPAFAFPARLAEAYRIPVEVEGMVGATTDDAVHYFDHKVPQHNPFLVVLEFGGNDFTHKIPQERTFANVAALVRRVQALGAAAVIVSVRTDLIGDSYGDGYTRIAREHGAGVVTGFLNDVIAKPKYMHDAIHPNAEGHGFLARRLDTVVRPILSQMPAAQQVRAATSP